MQREKYMDKTLKFMIFLLFLFIFLLITIFNSNQNNNPKNNNPWACISDKDCQKVHGVNIRCRKGFCTVI
ncbi:putative Late nodulin [Medicago truncatula]|uniref:Putative Late nodulin n=1 Tax=Medicago truncatula TaxID=3880 RepID=A0A396HD69_MEDTR|nr:putative Late nodulin [Medicago truncatula]